MKKDMSNIWRVDDGRRKLWRLVMTPLGIDKAFSDSVYGGNRKAQDAAIAYRDDMRKKHNQVYTQGMLERGGYKNARGICLLVGDKANHWVANWFETVEGKRVRRVKSFNLNKYGSDKAREKAIAYRKKKTTP